MKVFEKLNGRKGLLAIALVMAVVMALPFAAQYYTWKVDYTIYPLTENVSTRIGIPPTSGATSAVDVSNNGSIPSITLTKRAKVHFMVNSANTTALAGKYWYLKVSIKVGTVWANLTLVENGASKGDVDAATNTLSAGTYLVTMYFTYWTSAVTRAVGSSFVVNIYAEEQAAKGAN